MANQHTEKRLFSSTPDQWNEWTWNILQKSYKKEDSVKYRRDNLNLSSVDWHNLEFEGYDLSGFSFRNSTMKDIIFTRCSLEDGNFRKSNLTRIHFFDCVLVGLDFTLSRLDDCEFNGSDLILVNFNNTLIEDQCMDESSFATCFFKHTQIDGLSMHFTGILDCDLHQVSGLNTISKDSISFLDVNTIANSRGRIPDILYDVCRVEKKYRKPLNSLFNQ